MNNFFDYFMKLVAFFVLAGCAMYVFAKAIDTVQTRQEQYAIEHNCRYDYNGLCYTKSERPWLY